MNLRRRSVGAASARSRRFAGQWRRSLLFRVVATTLFIGLGTVALLGAYVTSQIRDGLVDKRVESHPQSVRAGRENGAERRQRLAGGESQRPAATRQRPSRQAGGARRRTARGGACAKPLQHLRGADHDQRRLPRRGHVRKCTKPSKAASPSRGNSWRLPDGSPGVVVGAPLDLRVAGAVRALLRVPVDRRAADARFSSSACSPSARACWLRSSSS